MKARRTIVFLAVNASYSHSSLAAWCLRGVVDESAWEWRTVEATLKDAPCDIAARVAGLTPDVVGATLYVFNRRFVLDVLAALPPASGRLVVAGGPECLGDNRELLTGGPFDVVVRGEGETSLPALLAAGVDRNRWAGIPGLCFLSAGRYHDGGCSSPLMDLDDIPPFYERALAGFRKPFVQFETSRGCGNGCLFCTSRDSRVRQKSLERVRRDLAEIRHAGVSQVRVVDRTFNEHAERAFALLRVFREEFPGIRFHLEVDPARVSGAFADAIAAGGMASFHVEAGVQSLSQGVCDVIGRRARVQRTLAGLERLCRTGVEIHVDLIAGLPGATLAGLLADVDALIRLGPAEIQLERLKLLPGTPLALERERWGLEADLEPPYAIRRTPDMSPEDLQTADRLQRFLDRFYNAPALTPAIREAVIAEPSFVPEALSGLAPALGSGVCPPLEQRLRALHGLLVSRQNPAARTVAWQWVRLGFSLRHGLAPARPWKGELPRSAVLVDGDAARPCARRWRVELGSPHIVCYGTGDDGGRCVTAIYRVG